MKIQKDKQMPASGSVKMEPEVLQKAREICKKKGLLLSAYITSAVYKENKRQSKF
jgi:hypothetical protein